MTKKIRKPKSTSPPVEEHTRLGRFNHELEELLSACPKCSVEFVNTGMIPDYPCADCLPKLERLLAWAEGGSYTDAAEPLIAEALHITEPKARALELMRIRAGVLRCMLSTQGLLGGSKDFAISLPIVKRLDSLIEIAQLEQGSDKFAKGKKKAPPPPSRTLAERLGAKPDARAAFDKMLLADGFTDTSGRYVRKGRKGKAEVLATWDAVVSHYGLEGFGSDGRALAQALMHYLDGFTISERPQRLREDRKGSAYQRALKSALDVLRTKR